MRHIGYIDFEEVFQFVIFGDISLAIKVRNEGLSFRVGTPGDLLNWLKQDTLESGE